MIRNQRPTTRAAFTLVEMMVSMALAIGIMWMLAESFKMGLDFTSKMRSTGQQSTLLNGAGMVLTRDLQQEHFFPDDNKPNRGVRLSDQRLDLVSNGGTAWKPPIGGFFRIISPSQQPTTVTNPLVWDADGNSVGTAVNHALHFTSILKPGDQNPYTASINGVTTPIESRAAEIAYFLVDSGQRTMPSGGQILYHLVRRQRLVAMTTDDQAALNNYAGDTAVVAGYVDPVTKQNKTYTLADLTNPSNRLAVSPQSNLPAAASSPLTFSLGAPHYGEDILLSNVLSFEVLVDWAENKNVQTGSTAAPRTFAMNNTEYPFDYLSVNTSKNTQFPPPANATAVPLNGVFDTWSDQLTNWNVFTTPSANVLPLAIRVKQIQVTIRIFDPKTKQSRQNTWKFSM